MKINQFKDRLNQYASQAVPFIFVIDFEMQKPVIFKLDEAANQAVFFEVNGYGNLESEKPNLSAKVFDIESVDKKKYNKAFDLVQYHIKQGDTYLLNLTCSTPIETDKKLIDIFRLAKSPYKLLFRDEFISFSPETFIKIQGNDIFSYPMKGTIDANVPNAAKIILSDKKELFEHYTIVDLIRNDLSIVAKQVKVNRFRYIDKIKTNHKELLQISSEIKGKLPENWKENLGDIMLKLLPAGSVSGAPKQKTLEIIRKAERQNRGYYTGVFGIFDGENLDSAVLIRYIEKKEEKLIFRSGGGITALSNSAMEYQELNHKIYVPIS